MGDTATQQLQEQKSIEQADRTRQAEIQKSRDRRSAREAKASQPQKAERRTAKRQITREAQKEARAVRIAEEARLAEEVKKTANVEASYALMEDSAIQKEQLQAEAELYAIDEEAAIRQADAESIISSSVRGSSRKSKTTLAAAPSANSLVVFSGSSATNPSSIDVTPAQLTPRKPRTAKTPKTSTTSLINFSGASGAVQPLAVVPTSVPTATATTPPPTTGGITAPGAAIDAPNATITVTGGTVHVTGGPPSSGVVVASGVGGSGGGAGSSGGGAGGSGGGRKATRDITEMIFSQMDLLNDETKLAIRLAPDTAARSSIETRNKARYISLQKKALETQLLYGSPDYSNPRVSTLLANLTTSPDPARNLALMTENVLQDQKNSVLARDRIMTDPTLTDKQRRSELAKLSESDRQLDAFANVLKRVTEDLNRFQQAIKPTGLTTGGAAGTGPTVRTRTGRLVTEAEMLAQSDLESRRNLYSSFQGVLPQQSSRYESQLDLTRATRNFANTMLNQLSPVNLTGVDFMGDTVKEANANQALADLQSAMASVQPNTLESRPIEELAVDLSRVIQAAIRLGEVIDGANNTDLTRADILNLVTATGFAETQQKRSGEEIDKQSAKNARDLEENLQAVVSQPGLLRRLTGGVQREAAGYVRDYLTGVFGQSPEATRAINTMFRGDQVVAYDDRGRARNLVGANRQQLVNLQQRVKTESGLDISLDDIERLQRSMARVQQARNQSPFNDTFFYAMSRVRDLQTLGQTVMGVLNLPQTIASTIGQIGDPQLRTDRIMTTARALSLSPETYTKALAAATRQQSMFGGTLARNLEDMTSFIPISNTYGVDVGKSVQVARKLAAFDPAQGMQGASIALKEFLSGNVSSLSRRFEINRSELSKINTGDANEMLDSLDALLAKMGVTDKLIDDQANSLATKYDRMTGRLETLQVQFSAFAVGAMTPILEPILGDRSFLARQSFDQNLQKVVNERLKSYGDTVLSNPDTGLRTLNVFSSNFLDQLDPMLAEANDATSTAALDLTSTTGAVSNIELYRRLGNMKADERRRIQQSAQVSVLMGMNQDQAILKAMRDIGGDFFTGEEFQAQRQPLGFYGKAFNATMREDMIKTSEQQMKFNQTGQRVKILKQFDADTYQVEMPDGRSEVVRLAGVDAPEKTTKEGQQATAFTRGMFRGDPGKEGRYATLYSTGAYDPNQRLIGSLSYGGRDIATALIATGNAAVYNYENNMNPALLAPLSALERNAANTGIGAINANAARLGLGANAEISDAVRRRYFMNTYLGTAGLTGIGVGAGVGGIASLINTFGTLGAAAGSATQLALPGFGAAATTTAAGTVGGAVALPAIIAAALAGAGYLAYAGVTDSRDTSSAKYRELYRLQSEENQRINAEQIGNKMYPQAVLDDQQQSELQRTAGTQRFISDFMFPGSRLLIAGVQALTNLRTDTQEARDEFVNTYVDTGRELTKYYNGLSKDQKRVYSLIVQDPLTKQQKSVFEAMQMYQTLVMRDVTGTDETARKLLDDNKSSYDQFAAKVYNTTQAASLLQTAQEYGIVSDFTAYSNNIPRGRVSQVISDQQFIDLDVGQQQRITQELNDQINQASWKRFAKEYTDQAMEKQFQISQQRFTQYVDLNALNSLAGMNSVRSMINPMVNLDKVGTGRANEDLTTASLRAMEKTIFVEGVKYDRKGTEELRTAQANAVKTLEAQITAFREQEELTRPFNLALKGTYNNFIQTLRSAGVQYENIVTFLSQGNPRGFLDISQQMSGFNLQTIMQNRITTQNQNIMGITGPTTMGTGPIPVGSSFNFGYTTGPQGTLRFAKDFMKAPELSLFNPATIASVIMQGVQANTEIVQRNVQFGRQLRDADLSNRRSIEDINRNGMRTLEDIHRNYTRNMVQLAQQAELQKRAGTASFYTNATAANIPQSEKDRITALREQGQQKASHIEQADVAGYLKTPEGMQDTELQAAYAEYEAVPWTDYTAKEAAWQKVKGMIDSRQSAAEARMNNATDPKERSAAQMQLGYLSENYDRGAQYRKYVDDMANQQLEFASKRQQLTRNRGDLERERTRLEQQAPALQKRLAEARTPEEIQAANDALEENRVSLEKNSEALAQNAREMDSVTITAPLWADNWREAGKQILESSQSTISGLRKDLEDFDITYARNLEDAYRGFKNAKEDMVRQFTEAATEISQAVPAEFAKALTAITAYQRMSLRAEAYYNRGYTESAQSLQKYADMQLAGSLYTKGSNEYEEMVRSLNSGVNSMTADGMKGDDLTMGPSSLGAYGEVGADGKNYLRVIVRDASTIAPVVTTTTTVTGNGRDPMKPDQGVEP